MKRTWSKGKAFLTRICIYFIILQHISNIKISINAKNENKWFLMPVRVPISSSWADQHLQLLWKGASYKLLRETEIPSLWQRQKTIFGGFERNSSSSNLPKDSLHKWSGTASSGDSKRPREEATNLLGHHLLHHVKDDVAQGAGEILL